MRFYKGQHTHFCGARLHTKTMFLCVLDSQGNVLLEHNTLSNPKSFLKAVAPYRDDLVVACECIFTWHQPFFARGWPSWINIVRERAYSLLRPLRKEQTLANG